MSIESRFYSKERVVTLKRSGQDRSIFRTTDAPLAWQNKGADNSGLLAVDSQHSSLMTLVIDTLHRRAFCPYGHTPLNDTLLGYNGELPDHAANFYLLGTGYHRPYHPGLRRFLGSDKESPFGKGGINCYAYCNGDPINFRDPSGKGRNSAKFDQRKLHPKHPLSNKLVVPAVVKELATETLRALDTSEGIAKQAAFSTTMTLATGRPSNNEDYFTYTHNIKEVNILSANKALMKEMTFERVTILKERALRMESKVDFLRNTKEAALLVEYGEKAQQRRIESIITSMLAWSTISPHR